MNNFDAAFRRIDARSKAILKEKAKIKAARGKIELALTEAFSDLSFKEWNEWCWENFGEGITFDETESYPSIIPEEFPGIVADKIRCSSK